jgi:hypothetical protein
MTAVDKTTLKTYFQTGNKPTQAEFENLIDSLALASESQPLDADLTAIAALTTTEFGRALLTYANAAAVKTALELATVATSASATDLTSGTLAAARLPNTFNHAIKVTQSGLGAVGLDPGGPVQTGHVSWFKPNGTRQGYMGFDGDNNISLVNEVGGQFVTGPATFTQTATPGNLVSLSGPNSVTGALGVHALSNGGVYLQASSGKDLRLRIGSTDHVIVDASGATFNGPITSTNGHIVARRNPSAIGGAQIYLGDGNFVGDFEFAGPGIGSVYRPDNSVAGNLAAYVYAGPTTRSEVWRCFETGNMAIGYTTDQFVKLAVNGPATLSGQVGIGTTASEGFMLDVLGTNNGIRTRGPAGGLTINSRNTTDFAVLYVSSNMFRVFGSGSDRFSLNLSSGNIEGSGNLTAAGGVNATINNSWVGFSDNNNYFGGLSNFRPVVGGAATATINGQTGGATFTGQVGANEFRLSGLSFSRVAQKDSSAGWGGGYNFNIDSDTPQRDSTGAVSAIYFRSGGAVDLYAESSGSPGAISARYTFGPTGATFNGPITSSSGNSFFNGLRLNGADTNHTVYNGNQSLGVVVETGHSVYVGRTGWGHGLSVNTTTGHVTTTHGATFSGPVAINVAGGQTDYELLRLGNTTNNADVGMRIGFHDDSLGSFWSKPTGAIAVRRVSSGSLGQMDFITRDTGSIESVKLSLSSAGATFNGSITSTFSSSTSDLSPLDLADGQTRLHKNTLTNDLKLFANDGGTIKTVTLT